MFYSVTDSKYVDILAYLQYKKPQIQRDLEECSRNICSQNSNTKKIQLISNFDCRPTIQFTGIDLQKLREGYLGLNVLHDFKEQPLNTSIVPCEYQDDKVEFKTHEINNVVTKEDVTSLFNIDSQIESITHNYYSYLRDLIRDSSIEKIYLKEGVRFKLDSQVNGILVFKTNFELGIIYKTAK